MWPKGEGHASEESPHRVFKTTRSMKTVLSLSEIQMRRLGPPSAVLQCNTFPSHSQRGVKAGKSMREPEMGMELPCLFLRYNQNFSTTHLRHSAVTVKDYPYSAIIGSDYYHHTFTDQSEEWSCSWISTTHRITTIHSKTQQCTIK